MGIVHNAYSAVILKIHQIYEKKIYIYIYIYIYLFILKHFSIKYFTQLIDQIYLLYNFLT